MQLKFTTDQQLIFRAEDHFIVCDMVIFPLTYNERMDLQKERLKMLGKYDSEDEGNLAFSQWMIELVQDRIKSIDVKVYELTDELKAMSDDEIEQIDDVSSLGDLTLVDRITDLESTAYYGFVGSLYPMITVIFGQGMQLKKKLIKSSPAPA